MKTRSTWWRWLTVGLWLMAGVVGATVLLVGSGVVPLGSDSVEVFSDIATALPSPLPTVPDESAASDDSSGNADLRDDTFGSAAPDSAWPTSPAPNDTYADESDDEIRPGQGLPGPTLGSPGPTLDSPPPRMGSSNATFGSAAAGSAAPTAEAPPAPAQPVDLLAEVDRKLAALELGKIAFNTPESIPYGDAASIELLVSLQEAEAELRRAVRGTGPVESARVQISDQMEARLTGLGFRIEAVTPERQAVSRSQRTRWQWQIEPTKPARLELHLTLSAVIKIDGVPSTRSIQTFEKTIYVEVPFGQRVVNLMAGNLELLSSLVLIPIVGGLWRHHRRRKRRLAQTGHADPNRHAA